MNEYWQELFPFLAANQAAVVLTAAAAGFLALILNVVLFIRTRRLTRRLDRVFRSSGGADLEELLGQLHDRLEADDQAIRLLERQQAETDRRLVGCLQHLGVVRFNAFDDTGSDLSFSVAFLDDAQNGVVLSSIYGREETRTYAKPVRNGSSSYLLTSEEQEALRRAMENKPIRAGKAAG